MIKNVCAAAAAAIILSAAPAASEVKLGVPIALSGPIEALVEEMKKSIELAVGQINADGGVLGQPLSLVYVDTACDAERATEAVESLIDADVAALLGPICSGVTLRQAQSVSVPAGLTTLSFASASPIITDLADNDLVFRTAVSDAFKGKVLAQLVLDHGITEIAVAFATDAYNTSVAEVFKAAFEAGGGRIIMSQPHIADAESYTPNAQALARRAENLVIFSYYGSGGLALLDEVLAIGKVTAIYGADGMLSDEVLASLNASSFENAHFSSSAFDTDRAAFQNWQDAAKEAGINVDSVYTSHAYDAAMLLALAIEAAGSADPAAISDALRRVSGPDGETILPGEFAKAREFIKQGQPINYDGASGLVDFDQNGDVQGLVSVSTPSDEGWTVTLIE